MHNRMNYGAYALSIALLALSAPALAYDSCAFRAPRNLDLQAAGIKTLVVQARAGQLQIRGQAGLAQVQARGTACASRQQDLAQIRLVQRREGERLIIAVEIPESSGLGLGNVQRSLDLELRVPARLALEVTDSSGDASVSGVAALQVEDSSGALRIADIPGAVRVEDNSGDIEVRNVGALHVPRDNSGDVRVSDVRGDVRVDQDGSGELRFSDIGGSVTVGSDGSGGIAADNVGGAFTVRSDGSGGIEHQGVRGAVRIPSR